MAKALCTDDQFVALWQKFGGYHKPIMEQFGFSSHRAVIKRRNTIEERRNIKLPALAANSMRHSATKRTHGGRRIQWTITNGTIIVGSDAHRWNEPLTTAQRGMIWAARVLRPTHCVLNGDILDGAKISNHPAGIWEMEERPAVEDEYKGTHAFVDPLHDALPPGCEEAWTFGNHDMRAEYRLAAKVPEYKGVKGFALKDQFPEWKFCMAVFVNNDVVIKHRWHGGIHATHNNALKGGRSVVTGHLHSQKVTPWTDWNGTRYGIDTGTLADPECKQFDYAEENPRNWRSGFAVLTFRDGKLLLPELVQVWDEQHIQFRGELIQV